MPIWSDDAQNLLWARKLKSYQISKLIKVYFSVAWKLSRINGKEATHLYDQKCCLNVSFVARSEKLDNNLSINNTL
jgi:hypothetical protein